jgi:hypothetical protein
MPRGQQEAEGSSPPPITRQLPPSPPPSGHYPKASGQQEVQTSIKSTTSDRPPRPVRRPSRDQRVNELDSRVVMLEEALVACWMLMNDEVLNASYRDYLGEATEEEVQDILSRRPDLRNQPPMDAYDRSRLRP